MLDTIFWISFWSAVAGVFCLAIWLGTEAWGKRCQRKAMANLKGMNRGVIDLPDWVKQPWQHDAGECTRWAAETPVRIEAFAASSVQRSLEKRP